MNRKHRSEEFLLYSGVLTHTAFCEQSKDHSLLSLQAICRRNREEQSCSLSLDSDPSHIPGPQSRMVAGVKQHSEPKFNRSLFLSQYYRCFRIIAKAEQPYQPLKELLPRCTLICLGTFSTVQTPGSSYFGKASIVHVTPKMLHLNQTGKQERSLQYGDPV